MEGVHSKHMTTLRNFEYLIAYGTEIQLFDALTGEAKEIIVPNYGPNMNREVIAIYPLSKNKLRISLGKTVGKGKKKTGV